jgi:hypothetical protein
LKFFDVFTFFPFENGISRWCVSTPHLERHWTPSTSSNLYPMVPLFLKKIVCLVSIRIRLFMHVCMFGMFLHHLDSSTFLFFNCDRLFLYNHSSFVCMCMHTMYLQTFFPSTFSICFNIKACFIVRLFFCYKLRFCCCDG